jgi:hypothetical protein
MAKFCKDCQFFHLPGGSQEAPGPVPTCVHPEVRLQISDPVWGVRYLIVQTWKARQPAQVCGPNANLWAVKNPPPVGPNP